LKQLHPSDSTVQIEAEPVIIQALEQKLGLDCNTLKPAKLELKDTHVEIDGYSAELSILCEVYAHIGKLKVAQTYKPINDVMKMLLIEKVTNKKYRKIFAVCDYEVEKQLKNTGWKAIALQEYDIEVIRVDISEKICQKIKEAQKRQYR